MVNLSKFLTKMNVPTGSILSTLPLRGPFSPLIYSIKFYRPITDAKFLPKKLLISYRSLRSFLGKDLPKKILGPLLIVAVFLEIA